MEDLKEMFAQMMKFQMESQQKNEEKLLQLQKENEERILKNEEKQQRFFLELQKQQEAFLKVYVITRLQIILLFSLKMPCGRHSKHFPSHQMRIRPLRHTTEDMKMSILPTVPIGLMQKKPGYFYESEEMWNKTSWLIISYQKNLRIWLFRNSKITVRIIQLQNVSIPQKREMSQLNKKGQWWLSRVCLVVNKNCDDFKLVELSADNFKCLIFARGLVSAKDAEIRGRVLSKLENEADLTLQKLSEDCQRIVSV